MGTSARSTTTSSGSILSSITGNPKDGAYVVIGTVGAALMPPVSASDDNTADDKSYDFTLGRTQIEGMWTTYNAERNEDNLATIRRACDDFEEALRLKKSAEDSKEQAAALTVPNTSTTAHTTNGNSDAKTDNATTAEPASEENPDQLFATAQRAKIGAEEAAFEAGTIIARANSAFGCFPCIPNSFFKPKMLPPKDTWAKDKEALEKAHTEYLRSRTRKNLDKLESLFGTLTESSRSVTSLIAERTRHLGTIGNHLNLDDQRDQFNTATDENKRAASRLTKLFCCNSYFEAKELPVNVNQAANPPRLSMTSMVSNK